MKTACVAVAVLLFFAASLHGADAPVEMPPREVMLSKSGRTPDLHVALTLPEGWSVDWNPSERGATIARVFSDASKGAEAIVIAATSLKGEHATKTAAALFDDKFLRETGGMLKARQQRRVRNDFWDGAYFQYDLSLPVSGGVVKTEVRNWMMTADGYLVQFQCYYLKNFSLDAEARTEKETALSQTYRDILLSVRRLPEEEKPKDTGAKERARRP